MWERALTTNEWPDATTDRTTHVELPTYDDESDEINTES
jgi:hypothetical protein